MVPWRRTFISCCHHHAKVAPASLWPWSRMTSMQFTVFPGQTVSSDSSSVLNDSTPELTAGIKSGKGNVDGDLETENSTLYIRDGMIHFFTNYNLDYFIRRCKPIPYFYTQDRGVSKESTYSPSVRDIRVTYNINCIHRCTLVNN